MRLAHAVAGLALVVPLAACSGGVDDDATTFCEQGEATLAQFDAVGALGDDPAGFADAIAEISKGFADADPPSAIADDWSTISAAFADLDQKLQGVDPDDQEAFATALNDFSEQANSTALSDASDRVSTYVSENCTE